MSATNNQPAEQDNNSTLPVNIISTKGCVLDASTIMRNAGVKSLYIKFETLGYLLQGIDMLGNFTNLQELTLLNLLNLDKKYIGPLSKLSSLVRLQLGCCEQICESLNTKVLPKMKNLQILRLECQRNRTCSAHDVLDVVTDHLDKLVQLELINFTIVNGFDYKLGQCKNLQKLLIVPIYDHIPYVTLRRVFCALHRAATALQFVTWVIVTDALGGSFNPILDENADEVLENIWLFYAELIEDKLNLFNMMEHTCNICWARFGMFVSERLPLLKIRLERASYTETFAVQMD